MQGLPENTNEHRIFRELQDLQATAARWGFEPDQAVDESFARWDMVMKEKDKKQFGARFSPFESSSLATLAA